MDLNKEINDLVYKLQLYERNKRVTTFRIRIDTLETLIDRAVAIINEMDSRAGLPAKSSEEKPSTLPDPIEIISGLMIPPFSEAEYNPVAVKRLNDLINANNACISNAITLLRREGY